jgi:hypothetical protein
VEWEEEDYPVWGGDVLWMVSVLLRYPVVGSWDAVLYKRLSHNRYEPKGETGKLRHGLRMLYRLARLVPKYSPRRTSAFPALAIAWYYAYRHYIRRGNPLKTLVRLVKLPDVALGMWLAIPDAPPPPRRQPLPPHSPKGNTNEHKDARTVQL